MSTAQFSKISLILPRVNVGTCRCTCGENGRTGLRVSSGSGSQRFLLSIVHPQLTFEQSSSMEHQKGDYGSPRNPKWQVRKQFFGLPNTEDETEEMNDDRDLDGSRGIPGGCHVTDVIKTYKGCMVNYPFFLTIPDIERFQASAKDIAICGFPKSGSVWLSAIVHMIRSNADPASLQQGGVLEEKVPYLEFCTSANYAGYRAIDQLSQMPPGRAFFTHLSYEALPPSIPQSKTKIISHFRNPKDVMVSTYFHLKSRRQSRFSGNLEAVVDAFINDEVCYGPYFNHLASYWKHHEDPNVFHLSFEELAKDYNSGVRRLGKFLGKDLTDEQLKLMAHHTSFDQMKENERTNRINAARAGLLNFEVSPFLRSGSTGNWKLHFTPELNAKVDKWIKKNLERADLKGLQFEFE